VPDIGWVNTDDESLVEEWRDMPDDPVVAERYLRSAYEQCVDFLPHKRVDGVLAPVVPDPVPERFRLAQILQARALYNSVIAGPGDSMGADGQSVTVFPMDWSVKNLLRPKSVGRVT
jgi:hypothetical protein